MSGKGTLAVALALVAGVVLWSGRFGFDASWPLSKRQKARLASVQEGEVLMYCSESCPACDDARAWLDRHRVNYSACNVEDDELCATQAQALGVESTPTFVLRHGPQPRQLVGWDPSDFMAALGD